jgi:glycosyltransferase involved in cell wall biosynthesis
LNFINNGRNNVITLVIDGFKQGGGQEVYKLIIPVLVKRFTVVNLIILEKTDRDIKIPKMENLKIYYMENSGIKSIKHFIQFMNLLRSLNSNYIISSFYKSHLWTSLGLNKESKLIWVEQNTYYNRTPLQWNILKIMSRRVSKVICVSTDIYKISYNPINFPNSVENVKPRDIDFVFVGRMTDQKDPLLLLHSFHLLLKNSQKVTSLHLIGTGELLPKIEAEAKLLGIMEYCNFDGDLPIEETLSILKRSKTLVSTSKYEGFGLARLEALASGCCVISTDTGGARDTLPLELDIGVFLEKNNALQISTTMATSLLEKYWEEEIIKKRMKFVQKFKAENVVKDWLEF